jgi:hypothetical protein
VHACVKLTTLVERCEDDVERNAAVLERKQNRKAAATATAATRSKWQHETCLQLLMWLELQNLVLNALAIWRVAQLG